MSHPPERSLEASLARRGVSRRAFLKFCGFMAASLSLPATQATVIAEALQSQPRIPVVWLEFQDCTGDTESFLRAGTRRDPLVPGATDPSITEIILDILSLDYHETLMVPAGFQAEASRNDAIANWSGRYLCVVEGSIPTADNGIHCVIGGRTALSILREVSAQALATIALGSCAWDGGLAHSQPNPTGAVGVGQAVPGIANLVNIPGCPANVVNLVACIVHYVTYGRIPDLDGAGRPRSAYHEEIHEECERHDHYEHDRFVRAWGDAGHQQGWCLRLMGCRGPEAHHNCPSVRWNDGASWPVAAGHGCIGCTQANFWDTMSPFYAAHGGDDDESDEHDEHDQHDEHDD